MVFHPTYTRVFAVIFMIAIGCIILAGCGSEESKESSDSPTTTPTLDTSQQEVLEGTGGDVPVDQSLTATTEMETVQSTPVDDDDPAGDSSEGGSPLPADVSTGETLNGTAAAEEELVSLIIGIPEGGLVTIRLNGENLRELGFYIDRQFTTSAVRAGDESPVHIATEEIDGTYVAVYDAGTTNGFWFSFRASGDYTVTVEAGNTLQTD